MNDFPEDSNVTAWSKREEFPLLASFLVEKFSTVYLQKSYTPTWNLTTIRGIKGQIDRWLSYSRPTEGTGISVGKGKRYGFTIENRDLNPSVLKKQKKGTF